MNLIQRTQTGQTTILNDLDNFNDFLSLLIIECERIKVDIQTAKEDLRNAKRKAEQTKRKAAEDRGVLAVANVGLGIGAAAAVVLSGGLALPIIFGTGQVITSICSKEIDREYEANIERIIAAVDCRSEKLKQRSRMVINKRKTYETTLNSLKGRGIEENEAIFCAICGMINEMNQSNNNSTFITGRDNIAIMDSSQLGIQQSGLIQKLSGKRNIAFMGISLASAEKYIPEWLINATKNVAKNLPKFAPKFVCAAATALTAGAEVCSVIRFALSKNKAVEVIDETTQLLHEGELSLDFFIGVFTSVRIHALQQLKECQKREMKEIKQMELQKALAEAEKARNTTIMIICIVFASFAFILALIKL